MLTLTLPEELERMLSDLSSSTGMSREALVEEAVRRQIEDLEDIHIAESRLKDLAEGRSERIPFDQVMRDLGLEP